MPYRLLERIARDGRLDAIVDPTVASVRPALARPALKTALSGAWLGHRLHPTLTDVAIGALLSAGLLDLVGGARGEHAADRLIGAGVAAALPTALTGLSDWVDTDGDARRLGFVHAGANYVALGCYLASLAARRRGRRGLGVALASTGAAALAVGGYIGGHLSYAMGVGVHHGAFDEGPRDWTPVVAEGELVAGQPRVAAAAGTEVALVKTGDRVHALGNRCSHAGCALGDGTVDGDTIVCACHGSVFRVSDGAVVRGPAASPQRRYDTRVRDGVVQVRAV